MHRHTRVSPALVVAMAALFISLGGVGYAALKLPRNSVTTVQVKDRSLLARDFRAGQLPRGAPGATNLVVRTARGDVAVGGTASVTASCESGERATGGGYAWLGVGAHGLVGRSAPVGTPPNGWEVHGYSDPNTPFPQVLLVSVVCASP